MDVFPEGASKVASATALPHHHTMSQIINLNKARKQRAKADAERLAAENRVRFGRSKAEKQRDLAEQRAAAQKLDGHKLEPV
jgi:hypothetical protein